MSRISETFESEYSPAASQFVEEIGALDTSGIPEPHLPVWGDKYEESELRVGFVGRDTLGYGEMANFVNATNIDPSAATRRGLEEFQSLDYLQWRTNFGTNFWDTAFRILAGLHGLSDWKDLVDGRTKMPLRRFLWANVNSVELFESSPSKNAVNWETWRKVKDASEKYIDSLQRLLHVFEPHVLYIFNWYPSEAFLDSNLAWDEFADHQAYAFDNNSKAHVFVTAHPSWLNRNGLYQETVDAMVKRANKALQSDA